MLDATLRPLVDRIVDPLAEAAAARGVSANAVTAAGFFVGAVAVVCLAFELYALALLAILLNRLLDGLDGAVARTAGGDAFGGFFDIVADFLFYSGVVFGFALGRPEEALAAAFLIFAFVGTGSSFLAFAVVAARQGLATERRGKKAFYYIGGLTEGTETIAVFVLFCLFPDAFSWVALAFGVLCWITTASRIIEARAAFGGVSTGGTT